VVRCPLGDRQLIDLPGVLAQAGEDTGEDTGIVLCERNTAPGAAIERYTHAFEVGSVTEDLFRTSG
jgi:hypothetical protein